MFHISAVIEEHSRGECVTRLLTSVRSLLAHVPASVDSVTERAFYRWLCCRNSLDSVEELWSAEQLMTITLQ